MSSKLLIVLLIAVLAIAAQYGAVQAESQAQNADSLSFLDVIGNAFGTASKLSNSITTQEAEEEEESLAAPVAEEQPNTLSTAATQEEEDEEDDDEEDDEDEEEEETLADDEDDEDDEDDDDEEEETLEKIASATRGVIINPDALKTAQTESYANEEPADAPENVVGAEALSEGDLDLTQLLNLLGTVRTKSAETLDSTDHETFAAAQALLEAYKNAQ